MPPNKVKCLGYILRIAYLWIKKVKGSNLLFSRIILGNGENIIIQRPVDIFWVGILNEKLKSLHISMFEQNNISLLSGSKIMLIIAAYANIL